MYNKKHKQKTKDKMSKSHQGKTFSKESREKMSKSKKGMYLGEKHPRVKLTEDIVKNIKIRLSKGENVYSITEDLNIDRRLIYKIKLLHTWKHILPELNDKIEKYNKRRKLIINENNKLDLFRWSYSRINSFPEENGKDGCAYSWYKTYIEGDRGLSNAFADYGLAYHKVIEKFINGELFEFELIDEFNSIVKQCPYNFPPNKYVDLRQTTYNGVINHFTNNINWLDDFKILSCENKREYDINGLPFVSIVDLEAVRIKNKNHVIIDHKLANPFKKSDLLDKIKQLYVYSYIFKDVYGKYPDELIFNHFKKSEFVIHNFDKKIFDKTIDWLLKKVEYIEKQTKFPARCELIKNPKQDWFATQLCSHRQQCKFRPF